MLLRVLLLHGLARNAGVAAIEIRIGVAREEQPLKENSLQRKGDLYCLECTFFIRRYA